MRVNDRNLAGTTAAETGRTPETNKTGNGESAHGSRGTRSPDRVELSGTLQRLSQALGTAGDQRSSRVDALSAMYAAGKYQPDAAVISRAMVAEAVTSGE
jgi:hypothetical protein